MQLCQFIQELPAQIIVGSIHQLLQQAPEVLRARPQRAQQRGVQQRVCQLVLCMPAKRAMLEAQEVQEL